jgi:nucleoside-diphosphate-sugar epimerase
LKILLTGANGFTGKHFLAQASLAGYVVHALKADLTKPDDLKVELSEVLPDVVVHLAAISFVGHADANAFYGVNVLGTTNLLDALAALPVPPRKVLLASSANVYGNSESSPISESQAPSPVNHYAMSKLAMEYMAKTYLDRLPLFFVRPFNYVGLGQDPSFVIPKMVKHFINKAPLIELGNIDVAREFNDVRFVVAAYMALLDVADVGETYNICSGRPVTLQAMIALLTELTGHAIEVRVNPAFVRENEIKLLSGSPQKLLDLMQKHQVTLPEYTIKNTIKTMLQM